MNAVSGFVRHQRARGRGEIVVKPGGGETRLERLYQEGCAKIRLPRPDQGPAEAVLINTAGGLTGGDEIAWQITAGARTALVLTTQAAERVYRSLGDAARARTTISVGEGASVEWLPQETILFEHSHLHRTLEVDLAPGARFLALDAVLLGREAMGEAALSARFRDDWRIRREGRLLHAEATRLDPDPLVRDGLSLLRGARAFATLVYVGPDAALKLEPLRRLSAASSAEAQLGVSLVGDRLVLRALAPGGLALRKAITPIMAALSAARTLPRLWTF